MSFAWNLKTLRTEAGLTQGELAKRVGVSQKTVSSWETGRTDPVMKDIVSLCKVLNCSIDKLSGTKAREVGDITFEDILVRARKLSISELAELMAVIVDIMDQRTAIEELKRERASYMMKIEELNRKIAENEN